MNKNIDLTKILKDCPIGTKLYSTIYGEVEFYELDQSSLYPIILQTYNGFRPCVTKYGMYAIDYENKGECVLFPSKEQRDWSKFKVNKPKFDPNTLKPFDNVLVIDSNRHWTPVLFSYLDFSLNYPKMLCFDCCSRIVIPYNEDTKHLVGTSYKAPEYYRYWE